jgi:Flp pilus assembly protein TadG
MELEMKSYTQVSAGRQRRSSGNALVEWMFVLLPFLAFLSMFFDLAFALFSWTTIQNAVREGCRYAITYQTVGNTNNNQDASIKAVVQQFSMGLVPASSSMIHIDYLIGNPNATSGSPPVSTYLTAAPAGNDNIPGNVVEVSIQGYPLTWMIPISGSVVNPFRGNTPASISVYSSDVMGGYPAGVNTVGR